MKNKQSLLHMFTAWSFRAKSAQVVQAYYSSHMLIFAALTYKQDKRFWVSIQLW